MKAHECFRHTKGILCCLMHAIFFLSFAAITKAMANIDVLQILIIARMGMILVLLPVSVYNGINWLGQKGDRMMLFISAAFMTFAVYLDVLSYRLLPLAVAVTINTSQQAISAIFGKVLLREKINIPKVIGIILSIVGIVLSCKLHKYIIEVNNLKHLTTVSGYGIATALISAALKASYLIACKKLKCRSSISTTISQSTYVLILYAILCSFLSTFNFPPCGWQIYVLSATGLLSAVSIFFHMVAINIDDVTIVSVACSGWFVIVSFLAQIIFFAEIPDIFLISGAITLILSIVLVGLGRSTSSAGDRTTEIKRMQNIVNVACMASSKSSYR